MILMQSVQRKASTSAPTAANIYIWTSSCKL